MRVEIQVGVEPHAVMVGSFLTFLVNLTNAGEVVWKRAKIVISIHNGKNLMVKKLVKRINNIQVGMQKLIKRPWRVPKKLKKGRYSYTVSAYYSRKKIGEAAGEFMIAA